MSSRLTNSIGTDSTSGAAGTDGKTGGSQTSVNFLLQPPDRQALKSKKNREFEIWGETAQKKSIAKQWRFREGNNGFLRKVARPEKKSRQR
jgi:hypothetical protein